MIDPNLLQAQQIQTTARLLKSRRNFNLDVEACLKLLDTKKQLQQTIQQYQTDRNRDSKLVGVLKAKGQNPVELMDKVRDYAEQIKTHQSLLDKVTQDWDQLCYRIPNIPDDIVPVGKDENDNEIITTWGQIPSFDFKPKDHVELGELLQGIDFKTAANMSGSRFAILSGDIALLHRALVAFMINEHITQGYKEINAPLLVNDQALYGTGQLPKFADDNNLFKLEDTGHYLIPTAEVPVTNILYNQRLNADVLPLKFVCHSVCFRSEAGSYGKDTRGLIRMHQFEKVELVAITTASQASIAHEQLTQQARSILEKLELPYRVSRLCTGDLGFASRHTLDLEVWLPGQSMYREISSCSHFGDFQGRRINARYRTNPKQPYIFCHTINGSALAVGRTLVAVLENHQQADGSINVPQALRKYVGKDFLGSKQP